MIIKIEDRAKQALRHLRPADAKKINRQLSALEKKTFAEFKTDSNINKLVSSSKEQFFSVRVTPELRMLAKPRKDHSLLVEDIVSRKVLEEFR